MIIGCNFHLSRQQVNWVDTETGDADGRELVHADGEAEQFYRQLAVPVLIGMEATENSQWFIELVEDLGHAIWIGDAAQIGVIDDVRSTKSGARRGRVTCSGKKSSSQTTDDATGSGAEHGVGKCWERSANEVTACCARCWWKAARIEVRFDPGMRKQYLHRCHHKPKGVANVAAARKLAIRLYWMLRT